MGDKLSLLLEERGMSARELARRLKTVSYASVQRWLNGETEPRLSDAARIAVELGCSLRYLADDRLTQEPDEPSRLSVDEQAVLVVFRAMGISADEAAKRLMGRTKGGSTEGRTEA